MAALGLAIGDSIDVGMKTLRMSRVLTYEPDRANNFYSLTPRVMMNLADLEATGVIQPGSRVTYRDLWRGDTEALAQYRQAVEKTWPPTSACVTPAMATNRSAARWAKPNAT